MASSSTPFSPMLAPKLPLFTRLRLAIRTWIFKGFVAVGINVLFIVKRSYYRKFAPTYTKTYPSYPSLPCRIFIPASYSPGTKIPLYINIHGGGFAIADPRIDDPFAHELCHTNNILVVSINYLKAPLHPFPALMDSAIALTRAVLADSDLPYDPKKVAIGGFSAGGNICLAVAQIPDIREKVQALVPIYPRTDFSKRHEGVYRRNKEGKMDILKSMSPMFNWAYITPGIDLLNPLLSPIYAPPSTLPNALFFITAEYDILCREAEIMARKLAGYSDSEVEKDLGVDESWEKENGEDGKKIRYRMVRDMQHGFTHEQLEKPERIELLEGLYGDVANWLKGVWGEGSAK